MEWKNYEGDKLKMKDDDWGDCRAVDHLNENDVTCKLSRFIRRIVDLLRLFYLSE
jgi:hypothetical protein